MAFKDVAKTYFETGDFPTEEQCAEVFDNLRWKDELIDAGDLSIAIVNQLNSLGKQDLVLITNGSFTMALKKKLCSVAFKNNSGASMDIVVGTTPGGNELFEFTIAAGDEHDEDFGKTFWADTTVYVYGVTGSLNLLIDRK
jgi:hypothetical protein